MDVTNAFLRGELDEELYMRLPTGLYDLFPTICRQGETSDMVCRLHKSIYGLKQAPRQWYFKLSHTLQEAGFIQSQSDHSLFTKSVGSTSLTVILFYVDDIILAGNDPREIKQTKVFLHTHFRIKELGTPKYFLGIEIMNTKDGMYLNQKKYALDLLKEAGMTATKPMALPLDANLKLIADQGAPLADPSSYRRVIGKLIYLTITRPDICYVVHILSQFMSKPTDIHMRAAKHLLRYLKSAPGQGIFFSKYSKLELKAFCDADWASCPMSRKSLTGYFIMLGDSLIAWKSKKQGVVSRSSCEAEYRTMATTCYEITWLLGLLADLGVKKLTPVSLYCNNQAALHLSKNPVFHERTKHIEVDCHFTRNKVIEGEVITSYISTKQQPADLLTKIVTREQYSKFLDKLGVVNMFKLPT
ncbi:hypothetical protein Dimus_038260 [Dionaea muscipula]